ncbi:MAG: hypothetical protein FJX75_12280 [Armatimonadetes bacterium]|nr:hypothetical protein [Armatimonadota bacterium]
MTMLQIIDGVTRVAGVRAAALCDYEGIPIEARSPVGVVNQESLCAWAAEMGRLAARTVESWRAGEVRVGLFESSMGSLMLADVGRGYLVVLSDPTGSTGMLRVEVERASEALRRLLSVRIMPSAVAGGAVTA